MELAILLISPASTLTTFKKRDQKPLVTFGALLQKQHSKNNFKVVTTPDATTLKYYQSIYTHCKQIFNIPDRIKVVKKSLGTEDLNSETLATYFQKLNFNIIRYCEETYPVQSQYSIDFESKTETSNKGKQKLKQYSKTTSNTSILPKTTAKHLQTPEQRTKVSPDNKNPFKLTTVNKKNDSKISEEKSIDSENKKDEMTAYITKIPEFNEEDIETKQFPTFSKEQQTNAFKTAFLEQFTDNNTSITLRNCFHNIKQEPSKSNKLIKNVRSHVPEDLNSAIQHAKRYEMAIEEANRTKLVNLAIGETSSAAKKKIDQLTKKVENYFTNQQQQQSQRYQPLQRHNQNNFTSSSTNHYNKTNKTEVINITLCHNNLITNHHYYQLTIHQDHNIKPTTINLFHSQCNNIPAQRLVQQNQFVPQNQFTTNNNRTNPNNQLPKFTHYHTQPSYLTIPEEQDFHHTALSEGRATAQQQQNPSYTPTTIPPARIAENANLSDIFPFEFEANESSFLLSNAATNKQKAITAMYTEAEVEGKAIHLILNSRSTGIIVTANGMKKTPVEEIDNFPFTLDEITIPVKVLTGKSKNYNSSIKDNIPEYPLLVVHSTNALKKPQLLNSNRKKKNLSLKHLWHLDQPPIGLMKLNNTCISPEEEYENHTCYYCKACYREQWGHLIKRSRK
ncbi:hypothetical protein G9A89_017185 [Geosiphon pyriformis]|nr:hypothetical protein G9A89_017185 [Geosiphon pyriformis]